MTIRFLIAVAAGSLAMTSSVSAETQFFGVGPQLVIDLKAIAQMVREIQNTQQIVAATKGAYDQASAQFRGIAQGRWENLEGRFQTALAVPSYLQQTAVQNGVILRQFETRFPNYIPDTNYANYEVTLANNTRSAAQDTLVQAGAFNNNFQNTETYTHTLLNAQPKTQEAALETMSILLQQDIEQLGKMGNLISAQSSNMAMYEAMEASRQVMNRTLDCEAVIKTVFANARQLDANITLAQVHNAVMANNPNCVTTPNATQ